MTASVEVDKSGASYYGEQTLHYLATNGETAVVQLREYCRIPSSYWNTCTYFTHYCVLLHITVVQPVCTSRHWC